MTASFQWGLSQCWGNVSWWMSHSKIWLNQWITWQSNFLDSDLSVECQDAKCPHVGHHSRVIVTADDTWRISGACHAVTSESCNSVGLWSRRGRSVLEEAPGISRAPLAPISRPETRSWPDVHTVTAGQQTVTALAAAERREPGLELRPSRVRKRETGAGA